MRLWLGEKTMNHATRMMNPVVQRHDEDEYYRSYEFQQKGGKYINHLPINIDPLISRQREIQRSLERDIPFSNNDYYIQFGCIPSFGWW